MSTSKSRHIMVDSICEVCGKTYQVRRIKVVASMAHFCSKLCFHIHQRKIAAQTVWGKEKGTTYFDSAKGLWMVHYYDNDGRVHMTTYPRWWWELNIGQVPKGCKVSFKDGNHSNIDPENFYLISGRDITLKAVKIKASMPVSEDTRRKMRENKHNFTGVNRDMSYPNEFSKPLKERIRSRDNNRCRICSTDAASVLGRVHHIDANKNHNDESNLILLCKTCHGKIHSVSKNNDPVILTFRSRLYT